MNKQVCRVCQGPATRLFTFDARKGGTLPLAVYMCEEHAPVDLQPVDWITTANLLEACRILLSEIVCLNPGCSGGSTFGAIKRAQRAIALAEKEMKL